MGRDKRVVVISDPHCGHRAGLTPPDWQWSRNSHDEIKRKFAEVQKKLWDFYTASMIDLYPIDALVVNGDAIDGKGERSGATELLTADRQKQIEMAAQCIDVAGAGCKKYIVAGTPYHTGKEEDWEALLATEVGAEHFGNHEWLEVNGVVFDFKHKTSSSVIPHGRYTGPRRAALWNSLWAERGLQPKADILIRSHVHYYGFSGDAGSLVMTTPALQVWTKYGSKECEGTNDIGFVSFDIDEEGGYTWQAHLLDLRWAAAKPHKL